MNAKPYFISALMPIILLAANISGANSNPFGSTDPNGHVEPQKTPPSGEEKTPDPSLDPIPDPFAELDTPPSDSGTTDTPIPDPFSYIDENAPISPNNLGIFSCPAKKAELYNLEVIPIDKGNYATRSWRHSSCSLAWKIKAPQAGKYRLELSWTTRKPGGTLEIALNNKKQIEWTTVRSGISDDLYPFGSERIGIIDLPAGESTIKITSPQADKGYTISIAGIRLIPISLDKKIAELTAKSRFGMSLENLELIWGKSFVRPNGNIARTISGDEVDIDAEAFSIINPKCQFVVWAKRDMWISAYLYNDKCVGLDINMKDKTSKAALAFASTLVPNIKFTATPASKTQYQRYSLYSADANKAYKFQYWMEYFELKASLFVRQEMKNIKQASPTTASTPTRIVSKGFSAQEKSRQVKGFLELMEKNATEKRRTDLLKKSIMGLTLQEVEILMGASSSSYSFEGKKNGYLWRDISGFRVVAIFDQKKCYSFVIMFREDEGFALDDILPIANQFLPGYTFETVNQTNIKSPFTMYTTDSRKRFKARWLANEWGPYALQVEDCLSEIIRYKK